MCGGLLFLEQDPIDFAAKTAGGAFKICGGKNRKKIVLIIDKMFNKSIIDSA